VGSADLSQPLSPSLSASLDQKFSKGVLAGGTVVRVRVFATDGKLIYSTDGSDQIGAGKVGDDDGIRAAAAGATTKLVDDDRVSTDGGASQSVHMLQAYVPLPSGTGGRPLGVVEVDQRMRPIEDAAKQPWRTVQLVAVFVAFLFLELGLVSFARATAAKQLASRSGFATAAAQSSAQAMKDAKAADKEAQIRLALEDQLETLRTQLKRQEEESTNAAREFAAQLQEASRRSGEPPRGAAPSDEVIRAADERIHAAELRAEEAERRGSVAASRVDVAEARLAQLEAELAKAASAAKETSRTSTAAGADDGEGPSNARRELEDLKAEHEKLRGELEAERARHEGARGEQEAMATRIGELERQSSETVARTDVQAERAESAEAKVADLQAQIDAARRETAEHRNRADATEAVRMELETKMVQITSRAQEAEQRAAQLEEKVREAVEVAREGNDKILEAQRSGDVVRQELVTVSSERDAIANERDALRAQLSGHQEDLQAVEHRQAFEEREQELVKAHSRIDELEAASRAAQGTITEHASRTEETRMAWETKVVELEAELKAHQEAVRALESRAELAERRAGRAEASLAERPAQESAAGTPADHGVAARIADLERERDQFADELEQMQLRLRRAYADAEDARAQLQVGAPPIPAVEGDDEVQRLRGELARAMDRAQRAENQASMLQADLAEARVGPNDDATDEPAAVATNQVDKSLRFRLARSAARKKGLGGEDEGGDDDNMWA
jgi:chromosome segregation ATPase